MEIIKNNLTIQRIAVIFFIIAILFLIFTVFIKITDDEKKMVLAEENGVKIGASDKPFTNPNSFYLVQDHRQAKFCVGEVAPIVAINNINGRLQPIVLSANEFAPTAVDTGPFSWGKLFGGGIFPGALGLYLTSEESALIQSWANKILNDEIKDEYKETFEFKEIPPNPRLGSRGRPRTEVRVTIKAVPGRQPKFVITLVSFNVGVSLPGSGDYNQPGEPNYYEGKMTSDGAFKLGGNQCAPRALTKMTTTVIVDGSLYDVGRLVPVRTFKSTIFRSAKIPEVTVFGSTLNPGDSGLVLVSDPKDCAKIIPKKEVKPTQIKFKNELKNGMLVIDKIYLSSDYEPVLNSPIYPLNSKIAGGLYKGKDKDGDFLVLPGEYVNEMIRQNTKK